MGGANLHAAIKDVFPGNAGGVDEPLVDKASDKEQPKGEEMPVLGYVSVVVMRQIVGPLVGAAVAVGLLRGVFGVNRPVVLMVGMLQTAGPPMINLAVMAGLSGDGEKTVAKMLLFTYAFSIISWTCSLAFFL